MNWLDLVLLIVIGGSAAASLRKGLTREIIGFVAVVLALLLGIWFYGPAAAHLSPYLSSRHLANIAGFALVFVGVMIAGSVVSALAGKLLKLSGLSLFDRLMGAGFGLLRGVLISVALVMAAMAFAPAGAPPAAVVNSRLAPYVVEAARVCAAIAPYELKEGFRKTYGQVRDTWSEALKNGIHGMREERKANKNEREL